VTVLAGVGSRVLGGRRARQVGAAVPL
jgi:hypothetical protein